MSLDSPEDFSQDDVSRCNREGHMLQTSDRAGRVRSLRATDQETARVVAIHDKNDVVVGAGCLISSSLVITCLHVVCRALAGSETSDALLKLRLVGIPDPSYVTARVVKPQPLPEESNILLTSDLALLEIHPAQPLAVAPVEFASPLRHGGKSFSVLGFPKGLRNGRNVRGLLHSANAAGLVQMDGAGSLDIEGGFSGAPVWSAEVGAFVGLVVAERSEEKVAWCIPSRLLCAFHNDLPVRFRFPAPDRPQIHDRMLDDPNVQIFGTVSDNGSRRLTATVRPGVNCYIVNATYECHPGSEQPRGQIVTFITHPAFKTEREDAYELFARMNSANRASIEFYPAGAFTLAAIGDGGDTFLALDLAKVMRAMGLMVL